ncbi:hypothetical protein BDR26DRAFT_428258 [Obelidium mucronatum]|nr:hypothetical protein BDR26DRAFT_428258 [Obelidium mucronatum]
MLRNDSSKKAPLFIFSRRMCLYPDGLHISTTNFFPQLLMTCNETLEGMVLALKDTIPRGCEWFIDSWGAHALNANEDLIVRAKIFSCLRKLFGIISAAHPPPSNRDILKDILERAISMETMSHVICTLFLDVDNQFSDSDLLDWAWRTQHFREDDYFVTSYADSTLEKVTSATFNHPHLYSEERLTRVINNLSSSLDVLKLILGDLVLYATQYHNLRSSQQISLSQDKKETRTNDEAQRSAYLKVEWFIQFLNKNPLKLTVLNARAALDTCSRLNMFLDPSTENENWQRLLNDFVGKMQSVILKSKLSNSHPALLCDAIPPSNIIQLLAEKRGQIMERDDPKITFMGICEISNQSWSRYFNFNRACQYSGCIGRHSVPSGPCPRTYCVKANGRRT